MANLNLKITTGETELAQKMYEKLKPLFLAEGIKEVLDEEDADYRVVFGGDGTMLKEARKDVARRTKQEVSRVVPIFGIKAGNLRSKGMLLNEIEEDADKDQLIELITSGIIEKFRYLEVLAENKEGNVSKNHAFNDVSTIRTAAQTSATKVTLNGKTIMERAMGDGLIICTPQGSTAYNAKAGGVITPAMNTIQITGNNSDFSNLVLNSESKITLVTLEPKKRPQRMEIDGMTISEDVRKIQIEISEWFSLLSFIRTRTFQDKMVQEALKGRR